MKSLRQYIQEGDNEIVQIALLMDKTIIIPPNALGDALTTLDIPTLSVVLNHIDYDINTRFDIFDGYQFEPFIFYIFRRMNEQACLAVLNLLLEHGANPHVKNSCGKTVLTIAKRLTYSLVVDRLQ